MTDAVRIRGGRRFHLVAWRRHVLLAWVWLALVVATAATPPALDAQAPRPADLAMKSVAVLEPGARWVFDEARNATVEAVIENVGGSAAGYQLLYEWRGGGQTMYLNEDQLHSTDVPDQGPLPPGERRTHQVTWRLQPSQIGEGTVLVTVLSPTGMAADGNRANDQAAGDADAPKWAGRLGVTGSPSPLHRGETGFLDIELVNEGTMPFSASLSLPDRLDGNRSRLGTSLEPADVHVLAGAHARATLFVNSPPDARDDTTIQTNFTLRAETSFLRNLTTPTPNVTTSKAPAAGERILAGRLDAADATFVPAGENVVVPLTITNGGQADDTYRITAETEPGWSATPAKDHLGLHAGRSETINVSIGSGSLAAGSAGTIRLHARSENGPASWSGTLGVNASGPRLSWGELHAVPDSWYVFEQSQFTVGVRNDGDTTPEGGAVHVQLSSPSGLTYVRTANVRPLPNSTTKAQVDFGPLLEGGSYLVDVTWVDPAGIAPPPAARSVFVHDPTIQLAAPVASGSGIAGERVAYRQSPRVFRVTNLGDAAEWVLLETTASLGDSSIEGEARVLLLPDASRIVPVVHEIPSSTGAATHGNVTVTVSILDHPAFFWAGQATTVIVDHQAPTVGWAKPPASLWTRGRALPVNVSVTDAADTRNATLHVSWPGGPTRDLGLSLAPDGTWTALIPAEQSGNFTLRASATDVHGNLGLGPRALVEVARLPEPEVRFDAPQPGQDVRPADPVQLHIAPSVGLLTVALKGTPSGGGEPFILVTRSLGPLVDFTLPSNLPPGNLRLQADAWNEQGGQGTSTVDVVVPPSGEQGQHSAGPASAPGGGDAAGPAPTAGWLALAMGAYVGRRLRGRR